MATTKTTATKAAKKTVKKAATQTTRKATTKKSAPVKTRMVGYDEHPKDFMTPRVTIQTLYWCIISALVLGLGIWIVNLQNDVNSIYDSIDSTQIEAQGSKF